MCRKGNLFATVPEHVATQKPVRVPEARKLFWAMFKELSNAPSDGRMRPNSIQFCETEAWARLKRWPLKPHRVDLIIALDAAWLEAVNSRGGDKPLPDAAPEALDAMFEAAGWY
ncbi:MAG: hypothetical protein AAF739_04885 [Pseudomonadota bacterium]